MAFREYVADAFRTAAGAARMARAMLIHFLMALALVVGFAVGEASAQVQTVTFDGDGRTIEYSDGRYGLIGMGHYLIQDGSGEYVMMFYKYVDVIAEKTYTSASVSYRYQVNRGAGSAVNITLMNREPSYDAAGFNLIRTSPSVGGFTLQSGSGNATTSLSSAVVDEMNRLSAAGGGRLYLGVSMASLTANVSASAYPFDVVADVVVRPPTITSISPNVGPTSGVYAVTVRGSNLENATSVTFGGVPGAIMGRSAAELQVATPAFYTPRTVDVVVTTPDGEFTLVNGFTAFGEPTLMNISPDSGPTAGNATVTLHGIYMDGAHTVTFDGTPGTVTGSTPSTVTVTTPPHAAGRVDVVVTTPGGISRLGYGYTYLAPPTITAVAPATGAPGGNTHVTIRGTNLEGASVTFGGVSAASVDSFEDRIIAVTPPGSGAVDVVVTTANGTATATRAFTYIPAPTISSVSPNAGSIAGGTVVTLTGTDFTGATQVNFSGVQGTNLIVDSSTRIRVTTPQHVYGPVPVSVVTPSGTGTAANAYTYVGVPVISQVSPGSGPVDGNATVRIQGMHLDQVASVRFGGAAAIIIDRTSTELAVLTPVRAAGTVDVVAESPGGTATMIGAYTFVAPMTNSFTAAPVTYNSGSATSTLIDLTLHSSGVTSYELNSGGGAAGLATTQHGGRAALNMATGRVEYTPPVGFRGNDSFQYRGVVGAPWATVTVPVGDPVFTVTLPEATGVQGATYNASNTPIIISGGQGPYTVTNVTGYPLSLGFDAGTQVLSGPVGQVGNWTVAFTIRDRSSGAGPFTSTVSAALATSSPPAPVVNAFTASPVAYNAGSAAATVIDVRPHASGVISTYWLNNGSGGTTRNTTTAQGGAATMDPATGQVSYTPPVGFRGNDSFQYLVGNSGGGSGFATVTIPVNDPVFTVNLPEATGVVGVAYNSAGTPVTVSGGAAPYSGFSAIGLPDGLTMNSAGVISGTPTTATSATVVVTMTDSSRGQGAHTSTATAALDIAAPTITLSPAAGPLPGAQAGLAYSQTLTSTGGVAPIRYELTAGDLPAGLSLANGVISGTPTQAGSFNFTVAATDSSGNAYRGMAAYSLTVGAPTISLSPSTVPDGTTRVAYSQVLTASGGTAGYRYAVTAGDLPPGFTLSSSGLLSGSTTAAGNHNFTVTATDATTGGTYSGSQAYTLVIRAPTITISPASLPGGTFGAIYSQTLTASGGAAGYGYSVSSGSLPSGLTLSSTGVLSGAPTAIGAFDVTVTATDANGNSGAQRYTLDIAAPTLTLAPGTIPAATQHTTYSQPLTAGGGTPGYRYEVRSGALPAGVSLSAAGVLSGTPTVNGTFDFVVRATDSSGGGGPFSIEASYSLVVNLPAPPTTGAVAITVAANSNGNPVSPALSGAPADSLAIGAAPAHGTASVSGMGLIYTPSAGFSGVDAFTYTATNDGGISSPATVTVTVTPPVLTLGDLAPATGQGGSPYSATLTASLGAGPYSYQVVGGALPTGVTLSSAGALSGTPTVAGDFSFEVRATDIHGATGSRAYVLNLSAPRVDLTPAAGALAGGLRTVAYDQRFTASGGTGPYAYAVTDGALPAGLTLAGDGVLSGAPTAAGSYGFAVMATDAHGFTGSAAYTLEVGTPAPVVQPQTATVVGGQSVVIDVTQGAVGLDILSVSVASPPSHGTAQVQGLSIVYAANGDFAGTDSFTYTVNNVGGPSAPGTVTITVRPAVTTGPEKTTAILAGQTATVELTEGATGSPFTGAAVVSVGPTAAGTATIVPRAGQGGVQLYDLVFTSADAFTGEARILYTLSNAFTTSAPGVVTITVEARPDPGLDPEVRGVATSQVTAAQRFADSQIGNFQSRLQRLRDGDNGSSNGLSLNLGLSGTNDDRDPRVALHRQLGGRDDRLDPGALNDQRDRDALGLDLWAGRRHGEAGSASVADHRLSALPGKAREARDHSVGFWAAGSIDWGRQDATGQRDNRFTTHGVSAGLDVQVNDRLIVGGGVGYGEDRTKIGDNGSQTEGRGLTGALYASWRPSRAFYVDGVLGFVDLDFTSRRWVQGLGGQPSGHAYGERSGDVLFASAAFGRMIRREGVTSDVYARLDAREMRLDAFTETGGGLAALDWDALDQSSLSANLGASFRWRVETRRHGLFMPSLRVEWSHELEDIGVQGVRYADWAGSPTYVLPLDAWSRNALNLGLGVEWSPSERLLFSFGLRSMLGDSSTSHGGQIGLKYGW